MSSKVTIGIIIIVVIILIFIIGLTASASSNNPTNPETVPEVDTTTPLIIAASGVYTTLTSNFEVIGENFKIDSTWNFNSFRGKITYISDKLCTISTQFSLKSGILTIQNDKIKSNEFSVTLTEEEKKPVIKLTSETAIQGETDNYYYYVFNKPVVNARVDIISKIVRNDHFGIICVAGGGGGGKSNKYESNGGGGASFLLTENTADRGYYFSVNVGNGGLEEKKGEDSSVCYMDSSGILIEQAIARGGGGGNYKSAGAGGTKVSHDDISSGFGHENTSDGGNGGDKSDGHDAFYDNRSNLTTSNYTDIPSELIGVDGISICYGGGGGGAVDGSMTYYYSGGEGGKGGNTSLETGGLRGVKNGTDYDGKSATHYGGGGGAAGGYSTSSTYGISNSGKGGSGKNGCVVFYILKITQ